MWCYGKIWEFWVGLCRVYQIYQILGVKNIWYNIFVGQTFFACGIGKWEPPNNNFCLLNILLSLSQVNGPSQVTAAILAVILFQNVTKPLQPDRSNPLLYITLPLHSSRCSWDSSVLSLQNLQLRSVKDLLLLILTSAMDLAQYLIHILMFCTPAEPFHQKTSKN